MIYLDHAATTQPYSEVTETLCHYMQNLFFNPAALYGPAIDLETAIKDALSRIGRTLGCDGRQLIVTSGATESTNTAIKGYCHAHRRRGNKIVITSGEHSATRESALFLESEGFEVERIPLTKDGVADLAVLKRALTPDVLLVSVIGVNNETGAVNDVETIAELKREFCPEAALHVDYVQGWNRLPLQLDNSGIDLASFSGHKIHGPKGIGLLYCREGIRLSPLIHGGGQQANRRSGTEHPAAVLALAKAAEIGSSRRRENMSIVKNLREFLLSELDQLNVQYLENARTTAVPHILNISFPDIKGETLLHMLEQDNIYVATGSACSSNKKRISPVLSAMQIDQRFVEGTLRISFDAANSEEELTKVAKTIAQATEQLATLAPRRRGR